MLTASRPFLIVDEDENAGRVHKERVSLRNGEVERPRLAALERDREHHGPRAVRREE